MDSKFFKLIQRDLKRRFLRYPERYEAIKRSRVKAPGINKRGKEFMKTHFKCQKCGFLIPDQKELSVDHIDPVVPRGRTQDDMTLVEYVDRLFCSTDNLQVLCKKCHDSKTKEEQDERRKKKKLQKLREVIGGHTGN